MPLIEMVLELLGKFLTAAPTHRKDSNRLWIFGSLLLAGFIVALLLYLSMAKAT